MTPSTTDRVFMALADPTRRRIVELLATEGIMRISDLAGQFRSTRQAVTKHLNTLCSAGIVSPERRGRERVASVERGGCDAAQAWLAGYERFWDVKLRGLKQTIEEGSDHGDD
jgi:DNA-binding transcriptional ArsR family regulator